MIAQVSPYWLVKTLPEMNREEWESLCDGCGKCCLQKLEDEDTGDLYYTDIACQYLDHNACSCGVYESRLEKVSSCISLSLSRLEEFSWLPSSCAYRLLLEGKPLPEWHPLITGDKNSVHQSGSSVRNRAICENDVPEDEWEDHIIEGVINL
ncbi:YcgN family cysteine cluster protein [Alkalimarinus coralli]|uniref:YcgN family cysteine cluster protein n=1 Tax=Alkalimarinus coralli TaxID=2935863 RepID=UPI0023DEA52A|nr:YcgN family cysteine cluster protein [Alkalimarinus coralli]